MIHALASYLPQDRYQALAHGTPLPDHATGAALFADISGFTPLTEALTEAMGTRRGSEALSDQINAVYDALIAQVDSYRGSVLGFAGDAITCWFDDREGPAAPRAAACAQAMQQAMAAFSAIPLPTGGATALALKVAVASGPARRFAIGDPAIQVLDVLAGATLARMAAAEHLAGPGEILLDQPAVAAVESTATIASWRDEPATGERFAVLGELLVPVPAASWPALPADVLPSALLRPWLLPAVYDRELAGQGAFLTELRPAVTLFLRFAGIDYDGDPHAGTTLDTFIRAVQHVLARYQGTLLQLLIGDKGSYLYAAFGAPIAHEDDARRAVLAALELQQAAADQRALAPLQIGISQGTLRCGAYGSASRRTYGVLGDEVNLAARLMGLAAPGETLVSGRVQAGVAVSVAFEPRPPIHLKGKAEPLPVFAVGGVRQGRAVRLQEPSYALPMVGRAAELAALEQAVERALAGRGQVVGITAEAGLGKSRLVAEGIRLARQRGMTGYGGACQATGTRSPYLVWQPIWQAFFDIDPEAPSRRQIRDLEGLIGDWAPDRVDALPLLGPLLGLPLAENDFAQRLEPMDRQGTLHALLRDCLTAAAREAQTEGNGLLLVLEDLHWIDAASDDLLLDLAQAIADLPVLFMLAYRLPDPGQPQVSRVEALPSFARITLAGLDDAAAEQLIRAKLAQLFPARGGTVPAELVARLVARAQGNPFYLEELLNYLHDRAIDPRDVEALDALELPDSLHRLILSRLDVLSARQQITLKTASVIGRRFRVAWLEGAFSATIAPEGIRADLAALAQLELTLRDTAGPELAYLFKHIVTREVAYESLGAATRAALHGQLAAYLEQATGIDADRLLNLLAYHYEQSDDLAKKRIYLRRAGEAAAARYANDAALAYLSRALDLAPEDDLAERSALLLAREQVYALHGARAEQHADLEALEALATQRDDNGLRAEVALRHGRYAERTGDYPAATAAAQEAVQWAQAAKLAPLEAAGYQRWGWALLRQRDYAEARAQLERSLALARTIGDRHQACLTLNDLGGLAAEQGAYGPAHDAYVQSLALARAVGDRRQECRVLGNLGTIAGEQGDLSSARVYLEQSLTLARTIGDRPMEGHTLGNLGFTLASQGDYVAARNFLEQSLGLAQMLGDRSRESYTLGSLGMVAINQADYASARDYYTHSLELARALGDQFLVGLAQHGLGNAALGARDLDAAAAVYQQSLATLRAIGNPALSAEPLAGLARVALARDDIRAALIPVEEILAHLASGTLDGAEEPMLVYLTCYQVLHAGADPRAGALLARARAELLERAAQIPEPAAQSAFLEQVPAHRELLAAWSAWRPISHS